MLQMSKTRRDILYLWKRATRHYRGGQEAGRATNQQLIHHVRHWNSQCRILALKITQNGPPYGNSSESQKLKKAREYLGAAKKHKYGTMVERGLEDEQYQMRTHEQGYTQSDLEEYDRIANEKRFPSSRSLWWGSSSKHGDTHNNLPHLMSQHSS